MEVHISSDDRNFITNVCNDVNDRLADLRGYACFSGYNLVNEYEYKVFKNTDDITEKFPKRITFGEMINIMRQSKGTDLFFQREDWRGTHNFVALNSSDGRNIFIELFYEDKRYKEGDQYFDDNGIPLVDSIPYIPSYDDMFVHSWIIHDIKEKTYGEKEKGVGTSVV